MKHKNLGIVILFASALVQAAPINSSTSVAFSKVFAIGEKVQTGPSTPVWVTPPMGGSYAGKQQAKVPGKILEGPMRSVGDLWWKIDFDAGVDGWVAQRDLRK
ncbi:MAG: hypothetical protein EBU36_02800, partial [Verrucomicrobia bacterium]|nr:hypothetical protein [Verrucomicrobiota bacterium]